MTNMSVAAVATGNRSTPSPSGTQARETNTNPFFEIFADGSKPAGRPPSAAQLLDLTYERLTGARVETDDGHPPSVLETFHKAVEEARDPFAAWRKKLDELREMQRQAQQMLDSIKDVPGHEEQVAELQSALDTLATRIEALSAELAQKIEDAAKRGDGAEIGTGHPGQMLGDQMTALFAAREDPQHHAPSAEEQKRAAG